MGKYSFDNFMKNSALETELTSLKTDHGNLLSKVKELETKLSEADKTMTAFPLAKQEWEQATTKLKADHTTEIETLKKDYQTKLDTANQTVEATKGSVNKEVVATLKGVGIQAGVLKEEKTEGAEMTIEEARAKLASLHGTTEAQTFYRENKPLFEKFSNFRGQ
jgi:chromosome segregation ATPase